MTAHEKLVSARLRLQGAGLKKSGRNSFAGYSYYELSDFLPAINQAAKELGFCCCLRFGKEEAALDFVDTESGERITFSSPMASAELKGCHPVQNLGAAQTYIRRYLYIAAFEIVEADALDAPPAGAARPEPPAREAAASGPRGKGAEMAGILAEAYPDGAPMFGEEDKTAYRKMWRKEGADAALKSLKALRDRRLAAWKGRKEGRG